MKYLKSIFLLTILIFGCYTISNAQPSVTDIQGNKYQTVKIGEQVWMSEDLKATKSKDGVELDVLLSNKNSGVIYYSWDVARFMCPEGWHLPSNEEWDQLQEAINKEDMKAVVIKGGSSGLNLAMAGIIGADKKKLDGKGSTGYYWTSTEAGPTLGFVRILQSNRNDLNDSYTFKETGASVRCIQD